MKIKVGNRIYDGEKEPVMIILSDGEKEQITNMDPSAKKYCVYPDTEEWTSNNHKKIKKWMKEV